MIGYKILGKGYYWRK